ncbi:RNA polymerase sigma-70 factor, ECF subfamily [Alloactinosynnema sp. L-07]|uniref:sigma-70 family RNA polymerase sigma factor n=1 Tax=Alloactinosynnema sp. L-07 TaxID=1653480 RepID=UPI00065F02CF|nr:sigma-70 family RNA polymerase sigma factor [Alloactinosynnema sp. L-07]CRK55525.1 RNA polymerase sigma-70 factor, ECF subfamily [Alloactinosynnema sp. L-07]
MTTGGHRPGRQGGAVIGGTIDAVWKLESAKIIAGLTRIVRDVGLAEELAQDALVAALEQWPTSGVPDNPGAWLMAIAKRRAVDHIRRAQRLERRQEQLAHEADQPREPERDDVLRLMFITCHPVLPTSARVALTLRLVGGLTAAEIARAFLVSDQVIAQRVSGAKRTLAEERVPFELPDGAELSERLSSVLDVIYLIFNEGYSATSGSDLIRLDLCLEALRLGRLLGELAPREAEVHGLVALMEIQASRSATRTGPAGEPVQLHEQDRGRWDQLLIRRGFTAMLRARDLGGPPGPYVLQAAIAVCHAQARSAQDTDWPQIAALYEALARLLPTPVVQLNRAVAISKAQGPQAGLDLVDTLLGDPTLRDYHLLPGVRGDLLVHLGRFREARLEFDRAAALARNAAERDFLRRRAAELPADHPTAVTLGTAAHDFLARDDLDPHTIRSYGQTLRRLRLAIGDRLPLTSLTADAVARAFETAWGDAAAATWNRHRATVRSFGAWVSMDIASGLDRRVETRPRTPPIDAAHLDALWARPDLRLRDRTLWRLLHESGAGVRTVLSIDVEHLDLDDRRARVAGTWVTWRAGTARLLPDLVAGRTSGPLFLADRRPAPARPVAPGDLCPETGRGRLSYERAEYLFKQATGHTLRQLKPGPGR